MLSFSLGQDLGLGLGIRVASISPAALFANDEQGIWLDPSDLSTMFQDSAGTTPVVADGDPVGLILDKSGNGNHASQSTASKRPTYKTDGTKRWLAFDGTDDFLVTGMMAFGGSDKGTGIVGAARLKAPVGFLFEMSVAAVSNAGVFYMIGGHNTDPTIGWYTAGRGSDATAVNTPAYIGPKPATDTAVLSSLHDIAGDLSRIRRNGTVGTDSTVDKGTGTFGNYPLYIGARGGSTFPLQGNIYGLIIRSALTTDPMLSQAERWMAGKTGVSW